MNETLGQRIQRLRQAAGLSQPQAAAAANVPVGTLRNWEQDRRIPALDVAARLAVVLGVSVDELSGVAEQAGMRKADAAADDRAKGGAGEKTPPRKKRK